MSRSAGMAAGMLVLGLGFPIAADAASGDTPAPPNVVVPNGSHAPSAFAAPTVPPASNASHLPNIPTEPNASNVPNAGNAPSPPNASAPPPVSLTINPDGTAVWDGEALSGEPALENKLARRTQQNPRLELDLHFHTVDQFGDSNRQTLLDLLDVTARYGYVHIESISNGVRVIVLSPPAAVAPK